MRKLSQIDESLLGGIQKKVMNGESRGEDKEFIESIKPFIENHGLKKDEYRINSDTRSVDILTNVSVKRSDLVDGKLPFKFGMVQGTLWLCDLGLESLENAPDEVGGSFVIYGNHLRNFEGGPSVVGGDFAANVNYWLRNLNGSPKSVGKSYAIRGCSSLNDISGISPEIGWDLEIDKKTPFSDESFRKYSNIKGDIVRK